MERESEYRIGERCPKCDCSAILMKDEYHWQCSRCDHSDYFKRFIVYVPVNPEKQTNGKPLIL